MNKTDLINDVAAKTGLTKTDAASTINAVMESVTEALGRGEEVALSGFGVFQVKRSKEREGRNPTTGEPITIAARNRPFFKAYKQLKDAVI